MTQPGAKPEIFYTDADGNPTTKAKAVGGEILNPLPDGRVESIIFTLDGSNLFAINADDGSSLASS